MSHLQRMLTQMLRIVSQTYSATSYYFLFTHMNGTFSKNILVRDSDNIYTTFEYELSKTVPENANANVIIDSFYKKVLWQEIIKNGIEVLIYSTSLHKVINIFKYMENAMGINSIKLSVNKIRKFCFIMLLLEYPFKSLNPQISNTMLIDKLDNTRLLNMNILLDLLRIPMTSLLPSEKYAKIKSKVLSYITLDEPIDEIKSFISMFASETLEI